LPHYSYRKTFQPGTTPEEAEELEMPCHWGILTDVRITFPPGCHGVCHVHVDEALHQIFPTNPEDDYALDGYTVLIDDEYELLPDTRMLYLRGYNTGTYQHTIDVSFTVKPYERYTPLEQALFRLIKIMERLMGVR